MLNFAFPEQEYCTRAYEEVLLTPLRSEYTLFYCAKYPPSTTMTVPVM